MHKVIYHISFIKAVVSLWRLCSHLTSKAPREDPTFRVYWNVPTFMCHQKGVNINVTKFGIIQNAADVFQGDQVNIWYLAGKFPHFDGESSIDGGIPQMGNLEDHKETFIAQVEKLPREFDGLAVLDFEHYLPSYLRAPKEYRQASRVWIASKHPDLPPDEKENKSQRSFDASIREFMEILLEIGEELRPNALWGYYHYPYCRNHGGITKCGPRIQKMNNDTLWIYEKSKAMYPSIYFLEGEGVEGRRNMATGRIQEAKRLNQLISKSIPILTYCWYRYTEFMKFLTPEDIVNSIGLSKEQGIFGSVIWGSSKDLNTREKCMEFQKYVENVLGPMVEYILEVEETDIRLALQSVELMEEMIAIATNQVYS